MDADQTQNKKISYTQKRMLTKRKTNKSPPPPLYVGVDADLVYTANFLNTSVK